MYMSKDTHRNGICLGIYTKIYLQTYTYAYTYTYTYTYRCTCHTRVLPHEVYGGGRYTCICLKIHTEMVYV